MLTICTLYAIVLAVGERNPRKKGRIKDMKEQLKITAEKDGNAVKIEVNGYCSDTLVYAVISSLLEGMSEGGKKNEN